MKLPQRTSTPNTKAWRLPYPNLTRAAASNACAVQCSNNHERSPINTHRFAARKPPGRVADLYPSTTPTHTELSIRCTEPFPAPGCRRIHSGSAERSLGSCVFCNALHSFLYRVSFCAEPSNQPSPFSRSRCLCSFQRRVVRSRHRSSRTGAITRLHRTSHKRRRALPADPGRQTAAHFYDLRGYGAT